MEKKKFLMRNIPYDLHEKLKIKAIKEKTTMENIIIELIKKELKRG